MTYRLLLFDFQCRLTRMMVQGFGTLEFVFHEACCKVLDMLKKNKSTVLELLDTFVYDPIIENDQKSDHVCMKGSQRFNTQMSNALDNVKRRLDDTMPTSERVIDLMRIAKCPLTQAAMYEGWVGWC